MIDPLDLEGSKRLKGYGNFESIISNGTSSWICLYNICIQYGENAMSISWPASVSIWLKNIEMTTLAATFNVCNVLAKRVPSVLHVCPTDNTYMANRLKLFVYSLHAHLGKRRTVRKLDQQRKRSIGVLPLRSLLCSSA